MKINAVFEGGGVKGIALAGAVHAAESKGLTFNQVAGTSSGAIVASLVAAGYTSDELKTVIEATPFSAFMQRSKIFDTKLIGPLARLFLKKGLYSGETLEHWIHTLLLAKGIRTFGDLRPNQLRIIASDISGRKLLVLPDDIADYGIDPVQFSISKAVRMSTSIPYFFDPVIIRKSAAKRLSTETFAEQFVYIVDGGLLSNFPLWLFDRDEVPALDSMIPTIGFQLVGRGSGMPNKIYGPLSMLKALFSTMMDAHDERYIEDVNRFRTVKIPTLGVSNTNFDISKEKSQALYESGNLAAENFFNKWKLTDYKTSYMQHVVRKRNPINY
ncbi:patatin-like phospholipase family protein [Paenibacillus radicis (ex Xue et al. 2023)]|uniref:Patatin-like phospholipase family protein n=1 Tax=Paenibacillus radicis (ex Xue et al. 2023) TaxID=2972489 RepID=A0ABT1YNK7_9BACL|nr:patatin-like phospholipase family protein [Paenibacillus radicis (ex Xue et al. 2023)]MCR8633974.1 patatin-like phospholipase family protein [Paenibacillus radicis (ex Xue et al. 2023)]